MNRACLLVILLMGFPLIPSVCATDNISVTFRQAQLGDVYRYWQGEGVLTTESMGSDIVLAPHGAAIRSVSPAYALISSDGSTLRFATPQTADSFAASFSTPKPSGHGIYRVSIPLPSTSTDRVVSIRVENAEKILYSNVDFEQQEVGRYLRLAGVTNAPEISLIYATELSYMLVADLVAAGIVSFILLLYLFIHRHRVRRQTGIRQLLSRLSKTRFPVGLKPVDEDYEFYLDFSVLSWKRNRFSLTIPHALIAAVLIIVLTVVFLSSFLDPVWEIWPLLEGYTTPLVGFGALFGLLSLLFLAAARTEDEFLKHIAFLGGAIVWMRTAYFDLFGLFFGIVSGLIIYFLASLIINEESGETP